MNDVPELTDEKNVWTWETRKGLKNGTLIITQVDVPFESHVQFQGFRKNPEMFFGEGIGCVAGPMTVLEYALRSLRSIRKLRSIPLGVLCYGDEGMDCRYSTSIIQKAIEQSNQVIVLRPGNTGCKAIIERRGQRKYFLEVEGKPIRLGKASRSPEVLRLTVQKIEEICKLSSRKKRIAVSVADIQTLAFPMLLPHKVKVVLMSSFPTKKAGDELEDQIHAILDNTKFKWNLELVSDRPPMKTRKNKNPLLESLKDVAQQWEIPFGLDSSVWPSVGGLVKPGTPVICGMGPVARDLYTVRESVERISVIQRALLLSQHLLSTLESS